MCDLPVLRKLLQQNIKHMFDLKMLSHAADSADESKLDVLHRRTAIQR